MVPAVPIIFVYRKETADKEGRREEGGRVLSL